MKRPSPTHGRTLPQSSPLDRGAIRRYRCVVIAFGEKWRIGHAHDVLELFELCGSRVCRVLRVSNGRVAKASDPARRRFGLRLPPACDLIPARPDPFRKV